MAINKTGNLDWFGSEYYLKLYRNRNLAEAQHFIDNLLDYLKPSSNCCVVDVCCGRGRHSLYLSKKGFSVTGIDLAEESIAFAKQFESENLKFSVQNILDDFGLEKYNLALNLFTSFGYFDKDEHSLMAFSNIAKSLKPSACFVIDYLNEHKVANNLVANDQVEIDGIKFKIKRWADDKFIRKNIDVVDGDKSFEFTEQVRRFGIKDFEQMLGKGGLNIKSVFGDYDLNAFSEENSDRLIIHAVKK
ncbi:MAG: class I SAM-dependent methyltransferase [Bacteroidia bacterium]